MEKMSRKEALSRAVEVLSEAGEVEAVVVLQGMLEKLSAKSSVSKAEQAARAEARELVLSVMEGKGAMRCSEVVAALMAEGVVKSSSYVSARLKELVASEEVSREVVKGVAFFEVVA